MAEINWTLIQHLAKKPHKHLNITAEGTYGVMLDNGTFDTAAGGIGEVMQEARTVQHLCDMAGVAEGKVYDAHIDARVFQLMTETLALRERLARIGDWHSRMTGLMGTFDDYCNECGEKWPCATRRMADGTYADDPAEEKGARANHPGDDRA